MHHNDCRTVLKFLFEEFDTRTVRRTGGIPTTFEQYSSRPSLWLGKLRYMNYHDCHDNNHSLTLITKVNAKNNLKKTSNQKTYVVSQVTVINVLPIGIIESVTCLCCITQQNFFQILNRSSCEKDDIPIAPIFLLEFYF